MPSPEYHTIHMMISERESEIEEHENDLRYETGIDYRILLFKRIEKAAAEIFLLKGILERTEEEYG